MTHPPKETPNDTVESEATKASESTTKKTEQKKSWATRAKGILVDVLMVSVVFFGVQMYRGRNMLSTRTEAPAFSLIDLETSEVVSLSDFEGDPVILHFWAPWCPVCQREFGMLNRLSTKLDDDEHFISIVYDWQDLEYIRTYVRDHDIRFPVLLADQHVASDYKVQAFPTNYYVSGSGQIRGRTTGMSTPFGMRRRMSCAGH